MRQRRKRRRRRGDGESDLDPIREEDEEYEDAEQVPIEPPAAEAMEFNENDIMGDFDRDENGNIILVTNKRGQLTDKQGRRVNERGYLRDKFGHIKHRYEPGRRVFSKFNLDEKGEIPLPFSYDRYNFNAHDILGDCDRDEKGNFKVYPGKSPKKTKGGSSTRKQAQEFVDKAGEKVNKKGFTTNDQGCIIDREKDVKFTLDQ